MDTSGLSYSQALYDTKFGGESDSSWLTIRHKFFVGLESWIALLRSDQAQLRACEYFHMLLRAPPRAPSCVSKARNSQLFLHFRALLGTLGSTLATNLEKFIGSESKFIHDSVSHSHLEPQLDPLLRDTALQRHRVKCCFE